MGCTCDIPMMALCVDSEYENVSDIPTVFKKGVGVLHVMLFLELDVRLFEVVEVGWI